MMELLEEPSNASEVFLHMSFSANDLRNNYVPFGDVTDANSDLVFVTWVVDIDAS